MGWFEEVKDKITGNDNAPNEWEQEQERLKQEEAQKKKGEEDAKRAAEPSALEIGKVRSDEALKDLGFGDTSAITAAYHQHGNRLKSLTEQGLGSAYAAPIANELNANMLAARAAMGSQGVRGGASAMALGSMARGASAERARLSQEVMQANMSSYSGHLGQQMNLLATLPLGYGGLAVAEKTGKDLKDVVQPQ